ncbi:MAG: putative LPS assembly protein LptD [Chitinophagaceae bacterium]|nr:putative LPS assembly protein LptD [Chitinophagaceae bacterium]
MNHANILTLLILRIYILFIIIPDAFSQPQNPIQNKKTDSLFLSNTDSTKIDSLFHKKKDSLSQKKIGDIKTVINYKSNDSLFLDVKNKQVFLYGQGKIDYDDITLEADRVEIHWKKDILKANYTVDTTGKKIGIPKFTQDKQDYQASSMSYNFKKKQAFINGVVSKQGEALMHGEKVKMNVGEELYIKNGKYTTCNLEDPHFHIQTSKLKVIPGNKIISGPFLLKFRSVPTILALPFGMFPQPKRQVSGVIFPTYGEELLRGFFLKNGGYYWAINDYVNLTMIADVFTNGSIAGRFQSEYNKKYAYMGGISFDVSRNKSSQDADASTSTALWVKWNHNPLNTGTGRLNISVNGGTSTYNQVNYNSRNITQNTNPLFSSSISYSKTFTNTPFSMSAKLNQTQNVQTNIMTFTLPDISVNMTNLYPIAKYVTWNNSFGNFLKQISLGYSFAASNQITNQATNKEGTTYARNFKDIKDFLNGNNGGVHNINIASSYRINKFFTLNPSFTYRDLWYLKELKYQYDSATQKIKPDTINTFSRAGYYTSGISLSFATNIYGTFFFKNKNIKAIRNLIQPNITLSFGYNPNFTDPSYGIFSELPSDNKGKTQLLSKYQGFLNNSIPNSSKNASISFSLTKTLEIKVRDKSDTTGKKTKKIKPFDRISIGTSYNLLAKSRNLSNISLNTSTNLLEIFNISFNGTINPYVWVLDSIKKSGEYIQHEKNVLAWNDGKGIGTLSNFGIALSFSLKPETFKFKKTNQPDTPPVPKNKYEEADLDYINKHKNQYLDFNIPWNLNITYNIGYTRTGLADPTITQSMSLNGDVSITKNTKITFTSGYDFEAKKITEDNTRFSFVRNIHCWEISVSWTPFGRYTSYEVVIRPKSSLLQDLRLNRQKSFFDNF